MLSLAVALLGLSCVPGPTPGAGLQERGELRPALSGERNTVVSEDGFFAVHWTAEGEDRPGKMSDADGNSLPDAVDRVLDGLELARLFYEEEGFAAVFPDGGGDDTPEIDVYIREIDAFGYAVPVTGLGGTSCYIELDPHLDTLGDGVAESVAAHELHHCVQYAYTTASHPWIYEATATFEQYLLFEGPALDAGLALLWNQRLRGADRPLHTRGDRFEYSGFVFLKFWAEYGGWDHGAVVGLWEQLALTPPWKEAVSVHSESIFEQSFNATFSELSVWKFFACSRDRSAQGEHFDASRHPCVLPAISVDVLQIEEEARSVDFAFDDGPYVAAFAEMPNDNAEQVLEVDCLVSGDQGALGGLVLVELSEEGGLKSEARGMAEAGSVFSLSLGPGLDVFGSLGFVSTSHSEVPASVHCEWTWVDPPESSPGEGGCECNARGTAMEGRTLVFIAVLFVFRRTRTGCR